MQAILSRKINAWESRWPLNTYARDLDVEGLSPTMRARLKEAERMTLQEYQDLLSERLRCREVYAELKNIVVWVKSAAGMGSLYRSQHEPICVFKSGTARHTNNVELGKYGRNRTNVWRYDSAGTQARKGNNVLELHPTVKPVQLVMDALLDCSNRGDIVVDSFFGSGTTLLAAERTGRICRGIELDPLYVDTAIRRWQNLTGREAVRMSDGKRFRDIEAEKEQVDEE